MDYDLSLQIMEEHCRICLQKGDINIMSSKVTMKTNDDYIESIGDSTEKSFFDLINVFSNQEELLILTNEFPYICRQCLEDLKFCYTMYEKIKLANIQLSNMYEESINQCIDEEHLIEYEDGQAQLAQSINYEQAAEETEIALTNILNNETLEEKPVEEEQQVDDNLLHINRSKHITLDSNDAFIITQFVPTTLKTTEKDFKQQYSKDDEQNSPAAQHLLTMNLKAVEVTDIKNIETPQNLDYENLKPAIYVCQYCPQAFAKSDYLKTHIQKSHVCKFCCEAFALTEDLFKHLREKHTEHKCAICHKMLSSHTNLRHHIRRVHRINLPAKVTLLDFIKSSNRDESQSSGKLDILQDVANLSDINPNIQYIWKNENNVEILSEHVAE